MGYELFFFRERVIVALSEFAAQSNGLSRLLSLTRPIRPNITEAHNEYDRLGKRADINISKSTISF